MTLIQNLLALFVSSFLLIPAAQAAVIADHSVIDEFDNIPESVFQDIRDNIVFLYSHTSHGSHILNGMYILELENGQYTVPSIIEVSDQAENYCSQNCVIANLNVNPEPPWSDPVSTWYTYMRNYLNAHPEVNVAMVSWGWEMYTQRDYMQKNYFSYMEQLEQDYPEVTFIYATGRMDGHAMYREAARQIIIDYVNANNKYLFDHTDISRHDPDGNEYPDITQDGTPWVVDWCATHDCPACPIGNSHSPPWETCMHEPVNEQGTICLDCHRKGKAFWWLLARISGWDPTGCTQGETRSCGSSIGICELGTQTCSGGIWGVCIGGVTPQTELCTGGLDEDCDQLIDCNDSDCYSNTACNVDEPPVRSDPIPTGTLPAGTTSTTIGLTTDEAATCRYSTTQYQAYANMPNTFSTTGGTTHRQTLNSLTPGYKTYYARCIDASENANTVDFYINFAIASSSSGTCTEGAITATCTCGSIEASVGYCCNTGSNPIYFDPDYIGCPSGDYFYVDTYDASCSDSGAGSESQPFCSMSRLMSALTAGDVGLVKGGSYAEPGTGSRGTPAIRPSNSGTISNPIIIRSYPGQEVNITNQGYGPLIGGTSDYIIWDGFNIYEGNSYLDDGDYDTGSVVFFGSAENYVESPVLKNCKIFGTFVPTANNHNGVRFEFVHNGKVKNCIIQGVKGTSGNSAGIMQFISDNLLIENNEFYNNTAGVYDKDDGQNNIYRYNLFRNSEYFGIHGTGNPGIAQYDVYQNIFYNFGPYADISSGVYLNGELYNANIYNNVFYGGAESGIYARNTNGHNIFNNIISNTPIAISLENPTVTYSDYNNFFEYNSLRVGWSTIPLSQWRSQTGFDTNSITSDPQFVSIAESDFHLQSNSPAQTWGIDRQDYDGDGNTAERMPVGAYITGNEIIGPINYFELQVSTEPARFGGSPTGTLAAGTTSASLSLSTDVSATCRYSTTSGIAYGSMTNTFSTTGGTLHSRALSGLSAGGHSYYVKCSSSSGTNTDDYEITFTISEASASGLIVSVDSTYPDSAYSSSNLIDENYDTTWASAEDAATSHWIEFDFQQETNLSSVTFNWAWNSVRQRYMTSQQVQIQYWDGNAYQTIITLNPADNISSSPASFTQTTASRYRFLQPAGMGSAYYSIPGALMWISEIEYNNAQCSMIYDQPPCNCVNMLELITSINAWYTNAVSLSEMMRYIKTWRDCSL